MVCFPKFLWICYVLKYSNVNQGRLCGEHFSHHSTAYKFLTCVKSADILCRELKGPCWQNTSLFYSKDLVFNSAPGVYRQQMMLYWFRNYSI